LAGGGCVYGKTWISFSKNAWWQPVTSLGHRGGKRYGSKEKARRGTAGEFQESDLMREPTESIACGDPKNNEATINFQVHSNGVFPKCPSCGRVCEPGESWRGSNYCRGAVLLQFIDIHPGLSGWELSEVSGLSYAEGTKGLGKLREYKAVVAEREDRGDGTYR
jgi:hypothetical protein